MKLTAFIAAIVLGTSFTASAQQIANQSPKHSALEFKLGGYKPMIEGESGLTSNPYNSVFGNSAMLLFETEYDRQLWQKIGTLAIGFSGGYAEKYGAAYSLQDDGSGNVVKVPSTENTALKVVPLRLLGVYRFDYPALNWNIPLVPYAKAALVYELWWSSKGSGVEYTDGNRGAGGKWGYSFTGGLSLLLDVLEPRLARDFDTDMGVNHSYFFAEFTYADVNNFGGGGLDLSSRHWMFGLALEY